METARPIVKLICALIAAGLALGAAVERRARVGQTQENRTLREQLSLMQNVLAEKQRHSTLVAPLDRVPARQGEMLESEEGPNEQANELVRLRNEVDTLQRQYRELETLRADSAQVRAALDDKRRNTGRGANAGSAIDGADFEILSAQYWTANTNLDVAAELQDRVRGNRLRAMASNNIKGDPDFGQVKNLTVVYRVGGAIRTNQFREGDVVILPPEQNASE